MGLCHGKCWHHLYKATDIAHFLCDTIHGAFSLELRKVCRTYDAPLLHFGWHHGYGYAAQAFCGLRTFVVDAQGVVVRHCAIHLRCCQSSHSLWFLMITWIEFTRKNSNRANNQLLVSCVSSESLPCTHDVFTLFPKNEYLRAIALSFDKSRGVNCL